MFQNDENNKGVDLSGALKNFDNGVNNEDKWQQATNRSFRPETSKIIQLVIKYSGGLVKDKNQANYVVLGLTSFIIIFSLFSIFGAEDKPQELNTADFKEIEQMPVNKLIE